MRYPTRLCCDTHWRLESEEGSLSRFLSPLLGEPRTKFWADMILFDWQGLSDRTHVGDFMWCLRREHDKLFELDVQSDMLAQYDAYMFYFCWSCSCSFGFVCNRLGQLQEARIQERFRVEERQRSVGYGLKEYDCSVQRRFGTFQHTPLVVVSLPGPCHCGAERCSRLPTPAASAQALAKKLACPLIEVGASGLRPAMESLCEEVQRIDAITKLAPVQVPRNARRDPTLHLGSST